MADTMNESRPGLLGEWREFFRVEPFGPKAINLMLARVCSAMAGGGEESYLPGARD